MDVKDLHLQCTQENKRDNKKGAWTKYFEELYRSDLGSSVMKIPDFYRRTKNI